VCAIVRARLRREMPQNGVILDGFPRTVKQAVFLDSMLGDLGLPRPRVLHLHVSTEALLKRLTTRRQCAICGSIYNLVSRPSFGGTFCDIDGGALVQREDDTEVVIRRRLAEYDRSFAPLLEYYGQGDYHLIEGDRNPEEVFRDLLEITAREVLVEVCGR
jgi:adenylate kinase